MIPDHKPVRDFINDHCITRAPPGSRELTSLAGNVSKWQFYLRAVTLDPTCLEVIATYFWTTFHDRYQKQPFQVAGVDASALPIMVALIQFGWQQFGFKLHAFSIRKVRKTYGLQNMIEGVPDNNLPVMFIDDLTSPTHLTFWHTVKQCTLHNLTLFPRGFVLVYKGRKDAIRQVTTRSGIILFTAMFDLDDFNMTWEEYETQKSSRDVLAPVGVHLQNAG